jgi:hypothetical protein
VLSAVVVTKRGGRRKKNSSVKCARANEKDFLGAHSFIFFVLLFPVVICHFFSPLPLFFLHTHTFAPPLPRDMSMFLVAGVAGAVLTHAAYLCTEPLEYNFVRALWILTVTCYSVIGYSFVMTANAFRTLDIDGPACDAVLGLFAVQMLLAHGLPKRYFAKPLNMCFGDGIGNITNLLISFVVACVCFGLGLTKSPHEGNLIAMFFAALIQFGTGMITHILVAMDKSHCGETCEQLSQRLKACCFEGRSHFRQKAAWLT